MTNGQVVAVFNMFMYVSIVSMFILTFILIIQVLSLKGNTDESSNYNITGVKKEDGILKVSFDDGTGCSIKCGSSDVIKVNEADTNSFAVKNR